MTQQLTLGVRLPDFASLDNFLAGGNSEVVGELHKFAQTNTGLIYIYGEPSSGKTHLLYATQKYAMAFDTTASYLSLADPQLSHDMVTECKPETLVCVDDLDSIAGDLDYERALMGLIEQRRVSGGGLLVAATRPAGALPLRLADVNSRLSGGAAYRLQVLSEREKRLALHLRAKVRGFELSTEVVNHVMHRYPRDLKALFALLDRIDSATLTAKRKVTIPFLKELEQLEAEENGV